MLKVIAHNEWLFDFAIDLHQWSVGFNCYDMPWPMWNVFFGPLRIGGCKRWRC